MRSSSRISTNKRRSRFEPEWIHFSDEELLDVRMCDLGIRLEGSVLESRIDRLYTEMANVGITYSALFVAVVQILFFINMFGSLRSGPKSDPNPWGATTLEWQTPDHPPKHGNWGPELPTCYRWAFDYSVPGEEVDFIPQNEPSDGHAQGFDPEHPHEGQHA